MAVATNLISVIRPVPTPAVAGFSIISYYHEPGASGAPNGKLHAYEFDVDGDEINHYEVDLPDSVNGSPTIVWLSEELSHHISYDSGPIIILRDATTGIWIWKPKDAEFNSYVWYNTSIPVVFSAVVVNGFAYAYRNNPPGTVELLRFDQSMNLIGVISSIVASAFVGQSIVTNQSYCIPNSLLPTDDFIKMPLDGSPPSIVTLSTQGNPLSSSPYDNNRCIVPEQISTRFHRLVSDQSSVTSHLWPNNSPWIRQTSFDLSVRSQYAQGYALGYEGRVILAPDNATDEDEIILDYVLPARNGSQPIIAGIGNIP